MRVAGLRIGCVLVAVLAATTVLWAEEPAGGSNSVPETRGFDFHVVHVEVSDRAELSLLEEFIDVWAYHPRKGIADARVSKEGEQVLRDFGFRYEIDEELTEKYSRPAPRLKNQIEGIPGYQCYRTVEETQADGAAVAAAYPDLAEWIDIGDSWEKITPGGNAGYDLMMLRLTNTTNGIPSAAKPKLWVMGAIHAREYVTAETVTRFAEHLLANYGVDPDVTWVLDHHEVHLLLVTNPDGRKHAEAEILWRKNTNENYCGPTSDYRGADLNRNCDFEWGPYGSPCDNTYAGPYAASEPETQAWQNWVVNNFPDWRPDDLTTPAPDDATGIFIDVHSYQQTVLGAFVWRAPPYPNDVQSHRLGRKLTFFTSYHAYPGGGYGGTYKSTTKDFAYGRLGLPAFTFELGTSFFQDCASFESTIYPDNLQALLYAARAVRAPYTQSSGPEVVSPIALPSTPNPGETVMVTAVIDDTRFGPGETSPPVSVETIEMAEFYVDVPPWQPGAVAMPLNATDGAFDSSIESVSGSFGSAGLADGRHIIYFRGQDTAGYWGTVRAAFVWVLDPSTAAHIAGQLTDSQTGLPIEGTITAGAFSAAASPATGSYDLLIPDGTYDVSAVAPGHYGDSTSGVVAIQGNTTIQNFVLDPFARALFDDVEMGNIGWTVDAPWAVVSTQAHSPVNSWHESPGGDSPDGANISLESPPLDLRSSTGVRLVFWHRYAIENNYDYGHVEWSADGGVTWNEVATYTGTSNTWSRVEIPLPGLDGEGDARVRFRFTSDSYTSYDGWYVDDISLSGSLFSDGFELGTTGGWTATSP